MCVVADNGGCDDDCSMEVVRWGPLQRNRSKRVPGVTVSHSSLMDSIAGHIAAHCGQAGVASTEWNVPAADSHGISVGCNYIYIITYGGVKQI